MAQGEGGGAGKVVAIVLGVTALLGLLCCGGGWLLVGDKVQMGINVGMAFPRMLEDLRGTLGPDTVLLPKENDDGGMVFVVGVGDDEDLDDPVRVGELQEIAWKAYTEAFAGGAVPLAGLAIGRSIEKNGERNAVEWRARVVSLTDLEERTGIAAPPLLEGVSPEDMKPGGVHIEFGEQDE